MTERALRGSLVAALSLALCLVGTPRALALQTGPAEAPAVEASEPAEPVGASAEAVRSALADGDLSTARELAVALREAEPTAEHFELEADVYERLGDYEQAQRAVRGALELVPADRVEQREALELRLSELAEVSRGTVIDEPASTERERLDRERAERLAALQPPPPELPKVDTTPKRVPIIKKWYFWVTLTALVASAAAITGVAISSAIDEREGDAASRLPGAPLPNGGSSGGAVLLRF